MNNNIQNSKRFIVLPGAYNLREFGGYHVQNGKRIRHGLLYRSDDLSRLGEEALAGLNKRNIKTIVDFRSPSERSGAPNRVPSAVSHELHLSIDAGKLLELGKNPDTDGHAMMAATNRKIVNEAQEQYREFFNLVASTPKLPLLFHCSAGKDRTGLAAALFLSALGAERELIYKDYMLSAGRLEAKYADVLAKHPSLGPMFTVRQEYLEAAFDEIDTNYGGVDNYLSNNLGVRAEKLKEIFLE